MIQQRSVRAALLSLILTAISFMTAVALAGPAQATATSATSASAGSSSFARQAYDPAKVAATKSHAATVKTVATTARTAAATPLPGFCTLDGILGATSYITCSVGVPATVYVWCSSGGLFYGYLSTPGIWSLTATPCFAIGYSLV